MNSLQTPSLAIDANVDPDAYWQLSEKPRFPTTISEWDNVITLPDFPVARPLGLHAFDLALNRKARRPEVRTMAKLVGTFSSDFERASKFFEPTQWRLLYYLDAFPLAALSNPGFDAERAFQQLYMLEPPFGDVPSEWTGSTEPSVDMLWDLRAYRHEIDADVAKAAWAIVSFARALNLEKNEVLQVPWWETWWIERCIAAYQTRR